MTHDTHPPPTHTHPTPNLGGCEEDLSNGRRGLLHRGHTYIHARGHSDSMTESAQWADSVKIAQCEAQMEKHKTVQSMVGNLFDLR